MGPQRVSSEKNVSQLNIFEADKRDRMMMKVIHNNQPFLDLAFKEPDLPFEHIDDLL